MIRVAIRSGLLGQTLERVDLPLEQWTPRALLDRFRADLPKSLPVRKHRQALCKPSTTHWE